MGSRVVVLPCVPVAHEWNTVRGNPRPKCLSSIVSRTSVY